MTHAPQTSRHTGQVIFITGGASGIGLATAEQLAARGCRIVLVDRAGEEARAAAAALGEGHLGLSADVTDLKSLEEAAAETVKRFGRIDVVVANAGVGSANTVRASTADQLLRIIDINLAGQIRTVKATLEHIIESRGYMTFTCSASVLKHTPKSSAYAAAKAAIDAFAGALRLEVMHLGVEVGVFYPGWTKTPLIQGPSSREGSSKTLPWPLSITNEVSSVAKSYARSIEHRARTTYAPKIYRFVHWLRPFYTGLSWDRRQRTSAALNVQKWEADFMAQKEVAARHSGGSSSK